MQGFRRKAFGLFIAFMQFAPLLVAQDTHWSCGFENDTCGITHVSSGWNRSEQTDNGRLQADVRIGSSSGDMYTFSIPYGFRSPRGNLSFLYLIAGASHLVVTTCRNQSEPDLKVTGEGPPKPETVLLSYSCPSIMDVEIKFIATRGSIAPLIYVDDIAIYEISYIEASDKPLTRYFATQASPRANVSDTSPRQSTTAHGNTQTEASDKPLTRYVATQASPRANVSDTSPRQSTTAHGNTQTEDTSLGTIAVSVISSVTTAFVICCLVLTVLLCRRFVRFKQNSSGSKPHAMALANHRSVVVACGTQQEDKPLGIQSIPVNTPMQGEIVSTSDYMGLTVPDQPNLYSDVRCGNASMISTKDEIGIDGDGYEVPLAKGDYENVKEPYRRDATEHVYPYDDVTVETPK